MLGVFGKPIGIIDQPVEECVVPLLVDQAGARSLKLMAHAAGAPDMDVDVLGIALIALPIALPSAKQRAPEGTGCCTTLTAKGIILHGHSSTSPKTQR